MKTVTIKKTVYNMEDSHESSNKIWNGAKQFVAKLKIVEAYLKKNKKYIKYDAVLNCDECDAFIKGYYVLNNIIWNDNYIHSIQTHNIVPTKEFVNYIYNFRVIGNSKVLRVNGEKYTKNDIDYIKLDKNQILIIDALLEHGGYTKKYIDHNDKTIYRYSEHSGLIDFNNSGVDKIIISGKTNRVDADDVDIFLPKNMPEALDFEYIFHTHPPTPKPGGRAKLGILYEIPSISDIFHFIDHYNNGETQGSIVLSSEGMYIITSIVNQKKIKINEQKLFSEMSKLYSQIQKKGIKMHGTEFSKEYFYSKIASDIWFIEMINEKLEKFKMCIDYYPRTKINRKWIIDTVYLPVSVIEPAP